ncbi:MAG: TIGR02679 family protein [Firmicutes bacterium]|jgi:uncharacterized protein (TIGR02679 family)|nr:TIGR02679 family protein [Bacillota bacterium]
MSDRLKEAVAFFREDAGYERLFAGLIEKYRSLGRLGGTVRLNQLTSREQEVLSAFFRKDYHSCDAATISVREMAEALQRTRFAGIDLKALLDAYAGEVILSKAEEARLYEYRKEQYFIGLKDKFCHPYCCLWLDSILHKELGTRGVHRAYDQDPDELYPVLIAVLRALEQVPLQTHATSGRRSDRLTYERLPVFASRIAGDPHAFDMGKDAGRFLVSALQAVRARQEAGYEILSSPSAEEVAELLGYFGLVRDDLLNFVTCAGILGSQSADEGPHPLWQAAWEAGNVLNVPLREVAKLDACWPGKWLPENRKHNVVFVVENSGVFSAILDAFTATRPLPPLVCTHGQFTLAALLLLDKLAESSTLLYSGDFDPEGLQMAQRLLQRYQGRVRLWRYSRQDYQLSLSEVGISQQRLNKLGSIQAPALLPVAKSIRHRGRAGYQEALVDRLIRDIKDLHQLYPSV